MKKIMILLLVANISSVGAKTILENVFSIDQETAVGVEVAAVSGLLPGSLVYRKGVSYMLNDTFKVEYKKILDIQNGLEKSKKNMKKLVSEIRLLELEDHLNPEAQYKRQILDGQKKLFLKNQESLVVVKKQYKSFLKLSLKGSFSQIKYSASKASLGSSAVIAKFFQNVSRTMLVGSLVLTADIIRETLSEAKDEVELDEEQLSQLDIAIEEAMEKADSIINKLEEDNHNITTLEELFESELEEL